MLIIQVKKSLLAIPIIAISSLNVPNLHIGIYSKSMRLHVHEFAQLAPEPTQPVTLRIDVTRVLYMDDYNY